MFAAIYLQLCVKHLRNWRPCTSLNSKRLRRAGNSAQDTILEEWEAMVAKIRLEVPPHKVSFKWSEKFWTNNYYARKEVN